MGNLNRPEDEMGLPIRKFTQEEFLEWEDLQPERHEYVHGTIVAMVGAKLRHNRIIGNLFRRVADHLDGSPCHVFTETAKLLAQDAVLYPDLVVTCGSGLLRDEAVVTDPKLIVEVLSPSTEGYDRRNKFILYRTLASLQEYVLIDPDSRQIEVFTRAGVGAWTLNDQTATRTLELSSLDLVVPFDHLFKGTATPSD